MADYINKNALRDAVKKKALTKFDWTDAIDLDDFEEILDEFSAADVAPVVRCGKCSFFSGIYCNHPDVSIEFPNQDDFCSYGKAR